jgi:membrane protein DedA with SNARE-associated domain
MAEEQGKTRSKYRRGNLDLEQAILNFINSIYQSIGWPGVVVLMAIESACIPIPSEIIMPLAGWMLIEEAGLSPWFLVLAGVCGGLGNVIGSWISYWVGAKGGLPLLRRYGKYILITHDDLDRANLWFAKYGNIITLIARFVPAVRTFISLPAGIARMKLFKFTLYALIGSFIWSVGLAYGGYALGKNWQSLREAMRPFDLPIVIAVLLLIAFYFWWKLRKIKTAEKL